VSVRLLLIAVLLLLGLSILLLLRVRAEHRATAELHGLARFRDQLQGRYPDALVAQVFRFLTERHGDVDGAPLVDPADQLARVHRLAALDLEDAVLVIADRAGARLPGVRDLDALGGQVQTVEDLLRFLAPFFRDATPST
jgi:hypothetical protein